MADWYEIRVKGRLADCRAEWLEGFTLRPQPDGTTTLAGPVADQAALHGVLARIRDLGLVLLGLSQTSAPPPPGGARPGEGLSPARSRAGARLERNRGHPRLV